MWKARRHIEGQNTGEMWCYLIHCVPTSSSISKRTREISHLATMSRKAPEEHMSKRRKGGGEWEKQINHFRFRFPFKNRGSETKWAKNGQKVVREEVSGKVHLRLTDGGVWTGQLQSSFLTHQLHLCQHGQSAVIVTCSTEAGGQVLKSSCELPT